MTMTMTRFVTTVEIISLSAALSRTESNFLSQWRDNNLDAQKDERLDIGLTRKLDGPKTYRLSPGWYRGGDVLGEACLSHRLSAPLKGSLDVRQIAAQDAEIEKRFEA